MFHARTARALGNFDETNIHFVRKGYIYLAVIRVFRISQKKGVKMVKLFNFYGISKKDLWGAYEWTSDIVDFFCEKYSQSPSR